MLTIYGIPNCGTVRKARRWLSDAGVDHRFHDVRADPLGRAVLEAWVDEHGWERLLNRAGTTFRKLDEADRAGIDRDRAVDLMLAHPAVMRRPVLDLGARRVVGFEGRIYAEALAAG